MTISGCYAASRNDANCNGQGFHYYTLRSGKFGQCAGSSLEFQLLKVSLSCHFLEPLVFQ